MQKTYYIFRHGDTAVSKKGGRYWHKIYSAPILTEAQPAIKRLSLYLKDIPSDLNISSPYRRCQQTVDIVSKITGKKFAFDTRLGEFFELGFYFKRRVVGLLKELEEMDQKTFIICTHGAVIDAMVQYFTKGSIHFRNRDPYPLPGFLIIIKGKKVTLLDFNNPR
jgi:broad specificity phosphatase PhoE